MGTQWIFLIGAGLVIVLYVILSVFFSNYIYSPIKDIRDSIGVEPEKDGNQDELELIGNAFSSYRRREDCYRWTPPQSAKPSGNVLRGRTPPGRSWKNFPIPFWRQWPLVLPTA